MIVQTPWLLGSPQTKDCCRQAVPPCPPNGDRMVAQPPGLPPSVGNSTNQLVGASTCHALPPSLEVAVHHVGEGDAGTQKNDGRGKDDNGLYHGHGDILLCRTPWNAVRGASLPWWIVYHKTPISRALFIAYAPPGKPQVRQADPSSSARHFPAPRIPARVPVMVRGGPQHETKGAANAAAPPDFA